MQPCCQLLAVLLFNVLASAAECVLNKISDFLELGIGILLGVKQAQVFKYLFLDAYQDSGQKFLVSYCVGLEMIRNHVVNILDKDDVGVQVIEVLDEGAVTSGTEQDGAVIIAEGGAVSSGGNGVGAGLLLGE